MGDRRMRVTLVICIPWFLAGGVGSLLEAAEPQAPAAKAQPEELAAQAAKKSMPPPTRVVKPQPGERRRSLTSPLEFYNRRQARMRALPRPAPRAAEQPGRPKARPETATFPATVYLTPPSGGSKIHFRPRRLDPEHEIPAENMSTVCEPSLAVRTKGKEVLIAGNWFTAISKDGGNRFEAINIFETFPESPSEATFTDQVVNYDAGRDCMLWLVQYSKLDPENPDTIRGWLRLAVAGGQDIASEEWRYYDIRPEDLGDWKDVWFDYPDLVLGQRYLYLTSNLYGSVRDPNTKDYPYKGSVVVRLPLKELSEYKGFDYHYYSASDQFGSPRATHGATTRMYWGAHNPTDSTKLRVYSWPEAGTKLQAQEVTVGGWLNNLDAHGQLTPYVAPGPDGLEWLGMADGRITAAWVADNCIGFAWTARQDPENGYPFPHVRVVLLDEQTKAVKAEPHLWNPQFAYAYPAAVPNGSGTVGFSVCYGGKLVWPSHAVAVLSTGSPPTWDVMSTVSGTDGPGEKDTQGALLKRWGDFLTIRRGKEPKSWVTIGYALEHGSKRTAVRLHYITFQKP